MEYYYLIADNVFKEWLRMVVRWLWKGVSSRTEKGKIKIVTKPETGPILSWIFTLIQCNTYSWAYTAANI